MLHAAVRKNPKQPSYVGLDADLSHAFDESGGIITTKFSRHIAEEQKAEAQILKQQRLWIEEQEAENKAKSKVKGPKGGGKGAAAEDARRLCQGTEVVGPRWLRPRACKRPSRRVNSRSAVRNLPPLPVAGGRSLCRL